MTLIIYEKTAALLIPLLHRYSLHNYHNVNSVLQYVKHRYLKRYKQLYIRFIYTTCKSVYSITHALNLNYANLLCLRFNIIDIY